jgi:hypothetical protein
VRGLRNLKCRTYGKEREGDKVIKMIKERKEGKE